MCFGPGPYSPSFLFYSVPRRAILLHGCSFRGADLMFCFGRSCSFRFVFVYVHWRQQYHTWARRKDPEAALKLKKLRDCIRRWERSLSPDHMSARRKVRLVALSLPIRTNELNIISLIETYNVSTVSPHVMLFEPRTVIRPRKSSRFCMSPRKVRHHKWRRRL